MGCCLRKLDDDYPIEGKLPNNRVSSRGNDYRLPITDREKLSQSAPCKYLLLLFQISFSFFLNKKYISILFFRHVY